MQLSVRFVYSSVSRGIHMCRAVVRTPASGSGWKELILPSHFAGVLSNVGRMDLRKHGPMNNPQNKENRLHATCVSCALLPCAHACIASSGSGRHSASPEQRARRRPRRPQHHPPPAPCTAPTSGPQCRHAVQRLAHWPQPARVPARRGPRTARGSACADVFLSYLCSMQPAKIQPLRGVCAACANACAKPLT